MINVIEDDQELTDGIEIEVAEDLQRYDESRNLNWASITSVNLDEYQRPVDLYLLSIWPHKGRRLGGASSKYAVMEGVPLVVAYQLSPRPISNCRYIARALRGESFELSVVCSLEINVHNFNPSATHVFGIPPG